MKNKFLSPKKTILAAFCFFGLSLAAQTSDQARFFINRSHVALAKIEKEMFQANKNEHDVDTKKAIKYQMVAVKLFNQGKFKDAVGYSLKSRTGSIEICNKMGISEGSFYNLNDDEKTYCNPANYTGLTYNPKFLSADENKKVDDLNLLDTQKFHELQLGITK